jgi:glycosyltransferase involved in cell wall biosynthesis
VRRPIEIMKTGVRVPPMPATDEASAARDHLGLPDSAPLLLYVGRLAREKNLDLLLEVTRHVHSARPDAVLLLVGDGPDRQRLQRRARSLRIADRVRFPGWVPHAELRRWYVAADIFVFPSTTETQGLSLLEAMAHGCAVVAANGPGTRDVITSGASGMLVAAEARRLAGAVRTVLDEPGGTTRLGRGARAVAEHLDSRRQARRLYTRYQLLIEECRRAARRGWRGLAARAWEETVAWR